MGPYRVSSPEIGRDAPPTGVSRRSRAIFTGITLWCGLALLVGAVAVFFWARGYAEGLPAPADPDEWLVSDPTLSAAHFALLLLWQLGIALLAWGWQVRHGASTLLWGASAGLSLGVLGMFASVACAEADGPLSVVGFFILPLPSLVGLGAGVVCAIALLVLGRRAGGEAQVPAPVRRA